MVSETKTRRRVCACGGGYEVTPQRIVVMMRNAGRLLMPEGLLIVRECHAVARAEFPRACHLDKGRNAPVFSDRESLTSNTGQSSQTSSVRTTQMYSTFGGGLFNAQYV